MTFDIWYNFWPIGSKFQCYRSDNHESWCRNERNVTDNNKPAISIDCVKQGFYAYRYFGT